MNNKYYTDIAGEKLVSNIRDFMLNVAKFKHNKLPWDVLPEEKQQEFIEDVEKAAEAFAKEAIRIVDTKNRHAIPIEIDSITIKDGVKSQIKLTDNTDLNNFIALKKGNAYLILSTEYDFDRERDQVDIKSDQPELAGLITSQDVDDDDYV